MKLFSGQLVHIGISGEDVRRLACDLCAGDSARDLFCNGGGAN